MRLVYQLWIVVLTAFAAVSLSGCDGGAAAPRDASSQRVIVVSIHPLASLVKDLVGDWARVETVVPPGASEHNTELTAEALLALGQADAVVINGMGLDDWIAEKARSVNAYKYMTIRFADAVGRNPAAVHHHDHDDHDHDHDHHDHGSHTRDLGDANPHLWLDPVLAARFVEVLAKEFEPLFPDKGPSLRARAKLVMVNVYRIDQDYRTYLSGIERREMITFHNAFDLLAKRYGLNVVAHLTYTDASPGGEPTAESMVKAIEAVRKHNLKVVYTEPQFPESYARSLSRETGVKVMMLDPLGDPRRPGYTTYIEMMNSNLETLRDGQMIK